MEQIGNVYALEALVQNRRLRMPDLSSSKKPSLNLNQKRERLIELLRKDGYRVFVEDFTNEAGHLIYGIIDGRSKEIFPNREGQIIFSEVYTRTKDSRLDKFLRGYNPDAVEFNLIEDAVSGGGG